MINGTLYIMMRTICVLLFSLAPFVMVVIQQRAILRQRMTLRLLPDELRSTVFWLRAHDTLTRRYFLPKRLGFREATDQMSAHASMMFAFWTSLGLTSLIMFSSWSFMLGAPFGLAWFVNDQNLLLLGPGDETSLVATQTRTLAFTCLSFGVAYVVIIYRMAVRLNVNEYSSLENLFDAVHLVSCIVISAIGCEWFHLLGASNAVTAAFAIAVGLRPDFYLGTIGKAVEQTLTKAGGPFENLREAVRPRISADKLGPEASLAMLDGLSDDVADRLKRIDVSTCHRLAFHNPFVIWVRTSFGLPEIVDWIDQALLAVSFPGENIALRAINVRGVVGMMQRLDAGSEAVAKALGVDMQEGERIVVALRATPQVLEIEELSQAMLAYSRRSNSQLKHGTVQNVVK